jgi:hypothetical protein
MWSVEDNASNASALFGNWFERYKKVYSEYNVTTKNLKNPKYNFLLWNSIIDKSNRRKRLKSTYHEGALELLIGAQSSATRQGMRLFNSGTIPFDSTDSEDENAQLVYE